jgi:hypothetical protein
LQSYPCRALRTNRRLYRAYLLKEQLRAVFGADTPQAAITILDSWLAWASRSRLAPASARGSSSCATSMVASVTMERPGSGFRAEPRDFRGTLGVMAFVPPATDPLTARARLAKPRRLPSARL